MTDEQKELLKSIGISESDYNNYYVSDKNEIFTPLNDKNGNLLKTGEQVYNEEYLNPPVSQPSETEKQAELINNLIVDNLNMQTQIDSLIQSNLGGN